MLFLIGLGLADGDVTERGLRAMKESDFIYCEEYTNKWLGDLNKLGKKTGKEIVLLSRKETENGSLIEEAEQKNVALLIPGDPLSATTHFELFQEAWEKRITCEIIHAASILTAVGETGLQLYKFGRTTTLAYPEEGYDPTSPYNVIELNKTAGLHSLVLLDVKEKKQMSAKEGARLLMNMEEKMNRGVLNEDTMILACSRLGVEGKKIKYDSVKKIIYSDMEEAPAVIIIPGELNFKEEEALEMWK